MLALECPLVEKYSLFRVLSLQFEHRIFKRWEKPLFKFVNSFLTVEEAKDPFLIQMLSKYFEPFICNIKHNFWEIGATFQNNVSYTLCFAQN